jgi:putative FmdB family regulatory protein
LYDHQQDNAPRNNAIMPIYEYRCKSCEHEFAHLHKRYSEPAPPCPKCGSEDLRKLLSTFSASVKTPTPSCPAAAQCPSAAGGCPSGGCCSLQ